METNDNHKKISSTKRFKDLKLNWDSRQDVKLRVCVCKTQVKYLSLVPV